MADSTSELDNVQQIDSILDNDTEIDSELGAITEVSITYTGLETDDIIITIGSNPATISATLQPMWYTSVDDFPETGSSNMLYVDITNKVLYIYDAENSAYKQIISDWSNIEEINGGGA